MKSALIAESNPTVRRELLRILGRYGWWVDAVDNVEDTLIHLHRNPPQVVLIDWEIGEGSGLTLLRAIKHHPTWNAIPVVMMMQTDATREQLREASELGANDFLQKPFSGEAVLKKLDRWAFNQVSVTLDRA